MLICALHRIYMRRLLAPPKSGMLPIQLADVLLSLFQRSGLVIVSAPIIQFYPVIESGREDNHGSLRGQIQSIPDFEIGRIGRDVGPGRNKTADIAAHDVDCDSSCPRRVGRDVGGNVGVCQRTIGEDPDER